MERKIRTTKIQTFGTGTSKYKLGKSFILENSVTVYVNNQKLKENIDYTIDYYSGTIQFFKPLTKTDYLKVIYEFTNPIQDFIPALSRKNFTGSYYTYNPSQNISLKSPITITGNTYSVIKDQNQVLSNRISLPHSPIKLGSEIIRLNAQQLTRGTHYYIKNDSGLIRFTNKQLNINDNVAIEYQYYKTNTESELLFGTNSPGPYKLKHTNILKNTLSIKLGQTEAKNLLIIYTKKTPTAFIFYYTITNKLLINYKYKELEEKKSEEKDTPFQYQLLI